MNIKILNTVKYDYKCTPCNNFYSEQRTEDESVYFANCQLCGNTLTLETETIILTEEFTAPVIEGKTFIWNSASRSWVEEVNLEEAADE